MTSYAKDFAIQGPLHMWGFMDFGVFKSLKSAICRYRYTCKCYQNLIFVTLGAEFVYNFKHVSYILVC